MIPYISQSGALKWMAAPLTELQVHRKRNAGEEKENSELHRCPDSK